MDSFFSLRLKYHRTFETAMPHEISQYWPRDCGWEDQIVSNMTYVVSSGTLIPNPINQWINAAMWIVFHE